MSVDPFKVRRCLTRCFVIPSHSVLSSSQVYTHLNKTKSSLQPWGYLNLNLPIFCHWTPRISVCTCPNKEQTWAIKRNLYLYVFREKVIIYGYVEIEAMVPINSFHFFAFVKFKGEENIFQGWKRTSRNLEEQSFDQSSKRQTQEIMQNTAKSHNKCRFHRVLGMCHRFCRKILNSSPLNFLCSSQFIEWLQRIIGGNELD